METTVSMRPLPRFRNFLKWFFRKAILQFCGFTRESFCDRLHSMIDIVPYAETDQEALHEALCMAFSDYLLPMQPTAEQFRFMLRQRGFDPALTWLAKSDGRIVGFWIMASNDKGAPQVAYTIATGTVPEYRGRGLAGKVFERMLANHKLKGVEKLELEVIDENISARKAYGKLGFEPERGVVCFALPTGPGGFSEPAPDGISPLPLKVIETARPDLWDWSPTWQNSFEALSRIEDEVEIRGIYDGDILQGYGAVIRPTTKLAQLAVHRDFRRKGIGSRILAALMAGPGAGGLQVINADARDEGFTAFMEKSGGLAGTRQIVLSLPL